MITKSAKTCEQEETVGPSIFITKSFKPHPRPDSYDRFEATSITLNTTTVLHHLTKIRSIFPPNSIIATRRLQRKSFLQLANPQYSNANYTTPVKVQTVIQSLNSKKTLENGCVTNISPKFLPKNLITFLSNIINSTIKLHYFSRLWKTSIVNCFYKASYSHNDSSYTRIILQSSLSKVAEKFIISRLESFTVSNLIELEFQHSFRKKDSCKHHHRRVADEIFDNLNLV